MNSHATEDFKDLFESFSCDFDSLLALLPPSSSSFDSSDSAEQLSSWLELLLSFNSLLSFDSLLSSDSLLSFGADESESELS